MSFFKTLVSPNKSVLKSEEESKKDSDDKSKKGEDLSSGNKVVEEQPVAVTVNSEQPSPEQILTQDTKPTEPNVQPQITAPASKDEGKAAKESIARPRPFWRKSFKGDSPTTKQEENVEEEQSVAAVEINSVNAAPEQIVISNVNAAAPNVQTETPSQPSGTDGKAEKETPPERPKPFWRKSFKGDPAVTKIPENVEAVQPAVAVTVNSQNAAPQQPLTLETKPTAPIVEPEIPSGSAKAEKESTPQRPLPFWRKSFKGDPQPVKNQENSLKEEPEAEQVTESASAEKEAKADAGAQAATSSGKGLESPDKGKKTEDGKNSKPKLMMFFKQLTLDLTDGAETTKSEKTVVAAVVEPPPPAPKIKENQKEKKVVAEKITKQESKDMPEAVSPTQQQVSDPALVQNGADTTKDGQLKRTEKRQSLGSFFKAIGPKRLSDAAVQTDPVCILPAEKAK
ncbi:hypothetical protein XENTR_v10004113 [Xenopus tropicalis]|nr:hypothetical protein XENTR_v10004113 [Xenopus tropicalis]